MIFQKPNPFPFSIRRNLEFPLREHGVRDRTRLQEKVETALRDVGLWDEVKDRLDGSAQALSGGQQQRLCLARAWRWGRRRCCLTNRAAHWTRSPAAWSRI